MPFPMKTEAGSTVDIPDGTYRITVLRVEEVELDDQQFGHGKRRGAKFIFAVDEVLDEEGQPIELSAVATAEKLTPKTKLWAWVEALTGETLEPGQDVELESLIALSALGRVENEADKDGIKWARIKQLMALPKTGAALKAGAPMPEGKTSGVYEGFLNTEGGVNWNAFMEFAKRNGVGVAELAPVLGVERVDQNVIIQWLMAPSATDRSLTGLVEAAKPPVPSGESPFA